MHVESVQTISVEQSAISDSVRSERFVGERDANVVSVGPTGIGRKNVHR